MFPEFNRMLICLRRFAYVVASVLLFDDQVGGCLWQRLVVVVNKRGAFVGVCFVRFSQVRLDVPWLGSELSSLGALALLLEWLLCHCSNSRVYTWYPAKVCMSGTQPGCRFFMTVFFRERSAFTSWLVLARLYHFVGGLQVSSIDVHFAIWCSAVAVCWAGCPYTGILASCIEFMHLYMLFLGMQGLCRHLVDCVEASGLYAVENNFPHQGGYYI
jgi:hypothetical protein